MDKKIFDEIIDLHQKDEFRHVSPGIINNDTANRLKTVLLEQSIDQKKEIISYIAENYKVRELLKYLFVYEINKELDLYDIAIICARNNGRRTARCINVFGIQNEKLKYEIALECCKQNPKGLMEYFTNFELNNIEHIGHIFKKAIMMDPESIKYVFNFLTPTRDVKINLEIDSIKEWIRNNAFGAINRNAICIYDEVKRRDVGLRLLTNYIYNSPSLSGKEGSRESLEKITGFKSIYIENISEKNSGYIADFYEILLEIQTKVDAPFFSNIDINKEVFYNKEGTHDFLNILYKINKVIQLSGISGYKNIVDFLGGDKGNKVNINGETLNKLNEYLDQYTKKQLIEIFKGFGDISNISQIDSKKLNVDGFLYLLARLNGKEKWRKELPMFFTIYNKILDDTIIDYKYEGNENEKDIIEKQIGFLTENQLKTRKENIFTIDYLEVENSLTEKFELNQLIDLFNTAYNKKEYQVENNDINENLNFNDKDLQKSLKKKYGTNYNDMVVYLIAQLKFCSCDDELKCMISKIKSIWDFLKIPKHLKDKLSDFSKKLYKNSKPYFNITGFTDNPNLIINIGDIVDAYSCHNIKSGSYIDVIPSYIVDANVKIIVSYLINEKNISNSSKFKYLIDNFKKDPKKVKVKNILLNTIELDIDGNSVDIPINFAHIRNIIKIGITENGNEIGLVLEPPIFQLHPGLDFAKNNINKIKSYLIDKLCAKENVPIIIPESRNPLGTYSDIESGLQESKYLLHPYKKND